VLAERAKALHFLGPIVGVSAPVPKALELYGNIAQRVPGTSVKDASGLLASMRVVKEPRELGLMRKAAAATARGHVEAMKHVKVGGTEGQLKDVLEAGFRAGGGTGLSYDSIVATGRNAASLHYTGRNGVIAAGDLILVDAAASVGGYACDVTRTFPASGKFSPAQRKDYELVLAAQAAAVARLKAGVYYEDVVEAAKDVFRKAGRIDEFSHGLGHFVGLDVHDPGDLSKPLPAGAVITMEPGLYLQSGNYGIRIEDLFLVTAAGAERLSEAVPRSIAEIEAVMAQ
jgi:Xaa-Pro aminopeptidase